MDQISNLIYFNLFSLFFLKKQMMQSKPLIPRITRDEAKLSFASANNSTKFNKEATLSLKM